MVKKFLIILSGLSLILHSSYGTRPGEMRLIPVSTLHAFPAKSSAEAASWFFIHPNTSSANLKFELKGANQISVENLAVFNGIANDQKVAFLKLDKGIHISQSAIFGTSKIQTSRGSMAVNSAIHFQNGSTYQFRTAKSGQTAWGHLNGTNMTGTEEIDPGINRHINGYASYEGAGSFTFPVGNGSDQFFPLTVIGNQGQTITTTWITGDPSGDLDSTDSQFSHNRNAVTGNVKYVYPLGQWDWHVRNSGSQLSSENSPANITPIAPINVSVLIPSDIDVINGNNNNIRLVGWNGSAWEELYNTSLNSGQINATVSKVFSSITLGTVEQGPLPVRLIMFAATQVEESAVLNWQTSEESNSESFEIERSSNGINWTKIGKVSANGNSQIISKYRYVDTVPLWGNNLYRLKMIDHDQTFTYSQISSLDFTGESEKVKVYPNPVSDQLVIDTNYDWNYVQSVNLYNQSGKVMYTSSNPQKTINVKYLAVGNYFLSLIRKDGSKKQIAIVIYR